MDINTNIGISDTATVESLKEYQDTLKDLQKAYKETLDYLLNASKNYQ